VRTAGHLWHGTWIGEEVRDAMVSAGLVLALLAAPFAVGLLSRARALLWVARVLFTAFVPWMGYLVGTTDSHCSDGGLSWFAVVMLTVGLYGIPCEPRVRHG